MLPRGRLYTPDRSGMDTQPALVAPAPLRYHPATIPVERPVLKQINVGIIGTGWCGGIRADTCATNPVVGNLHIAENRPERRK
jgi:hypothetical protein